MSFSSISFLGISRASAYSAVAASPTTSSSSMRGNCQPGPRDKNGVRSMYSARTLRSMSLPSTLVPVKVGLTGV